MVPQAFGALLTACTLLDTCYHSGFTAAVANSCVVHSGHDLDYAVLDAFRRDTRSWLCISAQARTLLYVDMSAWYSNSQQRRLRIMRAVQICLLCLSGVALAAGQSFVKVGAPANFYQPGPQTSIPEVRFPRCGRNLQGGHVSQAVSSAYMRMDRL